MSDIRDRKSDSRGFTLIELMTAVVIIAILATIGLVAYSNSQKVARDGKRISDIQEIQKALEQYFAVNNSFPGSNGSTATYPSALNGYFQGGSAPTDASSSAQYRYYSCPAAAKYNLCAGLENCGSKCNAASLPSDGCSVVGQPASGNNYYCVSQLSN